MPPRAKSPAIAQLVDKLRPFLRMYLEDRDVHIDNRGYFKCINPEHEDRNPSCHIIPGEQAFTCFSCGFRGDIFRACAALEDKPAAGVGWVYQNVYHLAKKFEIPFVEVEPTTEELEYMLISSMYEDAAAILLGHASTEEATVYPRGRGLTLETCARYGVAEIEWSQFAKGMTQYGHDLEVAKKYELTPDMFDKGLVTFLLKDQNGSVIGFARKYIQYDKATEKLARSQKKHYPAKYRNTSNDIPFFHKANFLYGLDTARKEPHKRLDVQEGYMDVLMSKQCGINTAVATCGVSFTPGQANLVRELGFHHINFVYDGDAAGKEGAQKNLDAFSGQEGLYITVMQLPFPEGTPEDQKDPDEYLKANGIEAYLALEPISAFEWKLDSMPGGISGPALVEKMLPLLLAEADAVLRGRLIGTLASKSKVQEEDIRLEVIRRLDKKVIAAADELAWRLSSTKDAKSKLELIQNASSELGNIHRDKPVDYSSDESLKSFLECCERNEQEIVGLRGWDTGWPRFNEHMDGLAKAGAIIGISGAPNSGKSAWVTTLVANLLQFNKDASVIYHILDDPREVGFAKLMSCLTQLPIHHILRAHKYLLGVPRLAEAYHAAKDWLADKLRSGALVVKGQDMGAATQIVTRLIDTTRESTGNQVVYFADSFHSLDEPDTPDERIRFKRIAEWTMNMTETRRMTMVFTVELTKAGFQGRPKLQHLAETGKLAFALKAAGMVYNELHDLRMDAQTFWIEEEKDDSGRVVNQVKRPIIELDWPKNKMSSYKGTYYYRFYDHVARVEEMSLEDLKKEKENAKRYRSENPNHDAYNRVKADSGPPQMPYGMWTQTGVVPNAS